MYRGLIDPAPARHIGPAASSTIYIMNCMVTPTLEPCTQFTMDASAAFAVAAGVQSPAAVRKGPWTTEEDHVLVNYIAAHGEGTWNNLARAAGLNRTGKSCRLRWLNYLRPDLRRGSFVAEEQELIVRLQARWGNKWSRIAKHLPGRTDNEVKNFWRTKIEKKHRNNKGRCIISAAVGSIATASGGTCGVAVDGNYTPAWTEGKGSSNNSASTGVTHDYGVVDQQKLMSISSVDGHHQAGYDVHGGGGGTSAGAVDFFPPEFLAASGDNFWAIDDLWSTVHPFHGNS